jgi:hypothetical protein
MIVPYSRFLERRLERDRAAAERQRLAASTTVDVIDVAAVSVAAPIPGPGQAGAEHGGHPVPSEKRSL